MESRGKTFGTKIIDSEETFRSRVTNGNLQNLQDVVSSTQDRRFHFFADRTQHEQNQPHDEVLQEPSACRRYLRPRMGAILDKLQNAKGTNSVSLFHHLATLPGRKPLLVRSLVATASRKASPTYKYCSLRTFVRRIILRSKK